MKAQDPKRLVADSYDRLVERHTEWAEGVRIDERDRYTARLLEVLPNGASVLELGCGTGGRTTRVLAQHFQLTGVDISTRSIELARQNVPAARFLAEDMTQSEFPPQGFDAVVAFYSIIHVPCEEQPGLFSRIGQWLRPGGLFLAALSSSGVVADYEPDWLGVPMFWSGFDPARARSLLEDAGLTITASAIETADEDGRPISFFWVEGRRSRSEDSGDRAMAV